MFPIQKIEIISTDLHNFHYLEIYFNQFFQFYISLQQNDNQMGYGSIVSIFDRLSTKIVLTNHTGSYWGFLATLVFIFVCLIILIPPVDQYFKGAYFESQFTSAQFPKNIYTTGEDLIFALVFKNKKTGELANHTDIIQNINTWGFYEASNKKYKIDLTECKPEVFMDAINPMEVKDCIMLPFGLQFDIEPVKATLPMLVMYLSMKCDDPFKCSDNSPFKVQLQQFLQNLAQNYYYQYIFNSKVLNEKGELKNQFHKIYSTEYSSIDGLGTYFKVQSSQKKYFVDDSILPWWNNRTYVEPFWVGKAIGTDVPSGAVFTNGIYILYNMFLDYRYSFRYYKKLDFVLGMIGGAVSLIYLFFWIVFSNVNRTLQKMKNAEELLLEKDTIISNDQNLHKVKIPFYFVATHFLPGDNKTKAIIQTAQQQIDIVNLIKKLKVTHRNLRTKGMDLTFKTKDVDLDQNQPQQFIPDRPVLQNYQITYQSYQALSTAANTAKVYENNAPVLALTQNNGEKIDAVMEDQIYDKERRSHKNMKEKILSGISKFFKFFDIFGARPMLNAQPQTSSCWGFFLTLVIITLSVLTFALTIRNMDSVKIITNKIYEYPQDHNYELVAGQNFQFAFCVSRFAIDDIIGVSKSAKLTFYKYSKSNGYEEVRMQKMQEGQFMSYFQLLPQDPYSTSESQNCFRPQRGQVIRMGGSHESINQAYFGIKLEPYCSGTPAQCQARKNQTTRKFLYFVNMNTYAYYISENTYSPEKGRIVPNVISDIVSQSNYQLNGTIKRTQTVYVSAIQLLDDTSKSFARQEPKTLTKTLSFSRFGDRNQQRKGDPSSDPAYILQFRPNGQLTKIILRSYKIDFLLGIIGGVFAFWYFFVHFFAKLYNSFKVRAKLAQVLHREDGYDESFFVQFLYLSRLSYLFCCTKIKQDVTRVDKVDQKMQRQLDYLQLTKQIDTCYRLSSSLHPTLVQKDLSLIYFRQKIDESQLVKPKRISQVQNQQFEDDEFLELDNDELLLQQAEQASVLNASNTFLPQNSVAEHNIDLDKILNINKSKQDQPLYDPMVPYKKQNIVSRVLKNLDLFKNPPELTLDGQRDVKSIIGGIMFWGLAAITIVVCVYFLSIYTSGSDFTVSHRRLVDQDLTKIDSSNNLGELSPGINLMSGQNFKFAISFNKKDQYYPHDVTQYIGPIGIRMLQYTITKNNGEINETYEQTEFEPCRQDYFEGFFSPYNDREAFSNITWGYCLPDGVKLSLQGTPSDNVKTYFKMNIYNKYRNATGRSFLNSFFKVYLVNYYMSAPKMDTFAKDFQYEMTKLNYLTDPMSVAVEHNLTFSKIIFTNKYYSRSRQTYSDKTARNEQRKDFNPLQSEYTTNLTFSYNGMLDHYVLDYPGGGELFGLVGGVIIFFTFIIYSCVSSYNQYRMKYLIGQRLYTFDKKLSGLSKQKGRKVNIKKMQAAIRKINHYNELEILLAWVLNPIGYIRDNYNFNKTLRRITLVIDRVEHDINLYNVYKNLFTFKNVIDRNIKLKTNEGQQMPVNLSSIYIKHIFNPDPIENSIPIISKESKKHKLSPFEEVKINKAIQARVDPQTVLGDKVLNKAFGLDDGGSVIDSRLKMAQEREMSEISHSQSSKNNKKFKKTKKGKVGENSEAKLQQPDELKDSIGNLQSFSIEESRQ